DSLRVLLMAQRALVAAFSGDATAALRLLSQADAVAGHSVDVDNEARFALQTARAALNPR
ncbi:MAG: hypothetical protein CFE44_21560, partial [Burkholderiales bacterium PBB4]